VASTTPLLRQARDLPGKPGLSVAERQTLRRIPQLRGLSSGELEKAQERMVQRSYQAGEVIWRTRRPLHFSGYLQSGEIDLETWVDGVQVRTKRLYTGDPLPQRVLQERRPHETIIARAITDVRLGILPELKALPLARERGRRGRSWLLPVLLFLLMIFLARADIIRITSGLFYLASLQQPPSMSLLEVAQKVDREAAFTYNEQGYRLFLQEKLPDAATAFDQAVARDPSSAPALNNLAVTDFMQGDVSQASGNLQQAVEQAPDNPTARYNLGITLMQLADFKGALRELRESGFIDPGDALPYLQQADLYVQTGDYGNAEQRARSAVELNPSLTPAYLLLGISLYQQGREADALAPFEKALALEPGNRIAAFYQALILGHQKQYDAALPVLYELLASSPDADEMARILAEIDALYRFKAEPAAAGP
jgi:tetratricopeptide (TPR) repeat protein